jgi:hypothetical protein
VVGGLPEAISVYTQTKDFAEVGRVHHSIVTAYREDFNKYNRNHYKDRVQLVFDRLPLSVGRKFKYVQISREHRSAELEVALDQLCKARLATRVLHSSANGVPLGAESASQVFKILYVDIGLMCAALNLDSIQLGQEPLDFINKGSLAEQFIGQELLYSDTPYKTPALYYWLREVKNAAAEVDYVISVGTEIIPVEIKAGSSGALKSLHQFLVEKKRHLALRLNTDLPSFFRDQKKSTKGYALDYELLSLPLYLVGQSRRLLQEALNPARKGA